ncbi:DNA-directed RNA polymerase subunit beta' [Holdemanella biformis]|jgi:DNA-directed RNA polymerase subunit beta'|uniref:DNA-directed RNA polymerase subunit beta' n=2 Tax=Holdemanella biformis TaxID=1735 RepID=B7C9U1_9FIRM|nr:DNA-directed RNA polymerase subunit beta' [Holdemanella biformis]EEC90474.1 DNA-directed RNA polymerase, beta' subunit [Holdemanella biformis DSM 3989]MCC3353734.1 DNA-directed RNA polymerase subunit beta' [Holdemanella biformis]RGU72907.1 DNA-directed RNA polymerase subunit beta' [Holdemanella biformis]RGU91767.1 DNA-directed RNA polymerase subunit beta' [Holdemanella biformis]
MSINNFASIQVRLASPETILKWSHGEVTKPETINYRSQKAERDGLFCERIFGPTKDWECACGKYKKVRFKGVVCDRCGVEITKASVRRERMGHIHLAAPVAHIWYLRGIPSRMALLLDVTPKQLEEVVYFVSYIVTDPKESGLAYKQILSEREFRENQAIYGSTGFTAQTGAEAVLRLLQDVDLESEYQEVQDALEKAQGEKRKKLIKRLDTINAFRNSENLPEWMILTNIPVIPPDLRPMLQLDGGRFATSDLNDLYRRVITRNNRLRKLLDLGTPNIIVQNEKRMLQESVDALIDNGRRSKPITGAGGRALKSLSHSLKGKQGRFRQNLLGKRVDFSGRSVIAVGPDLKMYQCGIPREMAVNLFKPFIINEIVNQGLAQNPKNAEKLIERRDPRIWDVVEKVIDGYPVLMNRAPTLHRLGIQAFLPKLVEGRAMRLHPLVCTAFNADFDGDQMAIHVPLGEEARAEALVMMLGSHNILGPKDGKPIVTPGQDMVMGNFYLTMEETKDEFFAEAKHYEEVGCPLEATHWHRFGENEGHVYTDEDEVMMAYQSKQVHLHTRIALPVCNMHKTSFDEKHKNDYLITTVGKIVFNSMFPEDFPYINEVSKENFVSTPDKYFVSPGQNIKEYIEAMPLVDAVKKKDLGKVIAEVFKRYDADQTAEILDQIKSLGFEYSTVAGITVALSDIEVAPHKDEYIDEGRVKADQLKHLQRKGMLTMEEWERHLSKMWDDQKDKIVTSLMKNLPRKNPINMMATSGARGNASNFTQLAGMRGLMAKPGHAKAGAGEYVPTIIEVPIYSCFREGLNVSEFFISTHGVRKGLTDTALKTAESGYLTRRLVDVAQDVIIKEDDCGTDKGYWIETLMDRKTNSVIEPLQDRLVGRYSKQDVTDPKTGELIIASDEFITDELAKKIVDAGVTGMYIRSVFTCKSRLGICRKCYGRNMATGKDVEVGEAIGIMAAQSIGEPGTQLTMRTFHTGGVAGAGAEDITQGLPRVEELFEARCPKGVAVIAQISGEITSIERIEGTMRQEVIITNEHESVSHKINANQSMRPWVQIGAKIEAGVALTEGPLDPKELLRVAGVREVQDYILKEVKKVYQSQGIEISDKHLEVMIKQMMKKVIVVDSGDTDLNVGVQLSLNNITKINREALLSGKTPATFKPVLLGISKSSVETDSFLSAASFQETTKVLTDATIKGKVDHLIGLKENVIIGKLIPAGTGCQGDRPQNDIVAAKAKELRDKRIARMNEVHNEDSEKFDKLVSGSDDRDMMDTVDSSVEESILQDAETTDNGSIDIQSEE